MAATIALDQWMAVRNSLHEATRRFADLLADTPGPAAEEAKATRHWSIAETAAHVVTISHLYTSITKGGAIPLPFPGIEERIRATTVDTVADLNTEMLRQFSERDPAKLGEHLRDDVDDIMRATKDADPAETVGWLSGARVPVAGLFAHLLNEVQIHGRDIARASGRSWTIPPRDGGMFLELFVMGMTRESIGGFLDSTAPIPERRISVEFRSKHMAPAVMVLQHRRAFIEEPGGAPDVRLSIDPVAFNLMMFGRISKARAVLTRKVVIGGRRPWLLPVFMRSVRFPG
ncbi:MAG TPA: DinB family protein [Streptosporangiaceae bacterium]|nr:DinB family protein [Streptosporangiaceae bacterium]